MYANVCRSALCHVLRYTPCVAKAHSWKLCVCPLPFSAHNENPICAIKMVNRGEKAPNPKGACAPGACVRQRVVAAAMCQRDARKTITSHTQLSSKVHRAIWVNPRVALCPQSAPKGAPHRAQTAPDARSRHPARNRGPKLRNRKNIGLVPGSSASLSVAPLPVNHSVSNESNLKRTNT